MAEDAKSWGLFSRLAVIAVAAMLLSIGLKPYSRQLSPILNRIKDSASQFTLEGPRRRVADGSPVVFDPEDRAALKREPQRKKEASEKPRDSITEKDKNQLKAVIDKL